MPRKPGEKLPGSIEELEGITKAAILLLSLDPESASKVLRIIEDVTRELAGLGRVPGPLMDQVIEEFYGVSLAHQFTNEGGLDYARVLLKEALDRVEVVVRGLLAGRSG